MTAPALDELFRITTSDGKYTLIQHKGGRMSALRHGEPWIENFLDVPGCRMTLQLGYELEEARAAQRPTAPIDMVLFCPKCGTQHVDAPEPGTAWTNPPHKSHLCKSCKHIWRPCDQATNGVERINTVGAADSPAQPSRLAALEAVAVAAREFIAAKDHNATWTMAGRKVPDDLIIAEVNKQADLRQALARLGAK